MLNKVQSKFVYSLLFNFLISSLFSFCLQIVHPVGYKCFSSNTIWVELITSFVIAPILETFLYFFVIYNIIYEYSKFEEKKYVYIIISGLCFGFSHFYNINYVLETIITGLFMADYYQRIKKINGNAFINVCLMHSLYNILVFSFNYVYNLS